MKRDLHLNSGKTLHVLIKSEILYENVYVTHRLRNYLIWEQCEKFCVNNIVG